MDFSKKFSIRIRLTLNKKLVNNPPQILLFLRILLCLYPLISLFLYLPYVVKSPLLSLSAFVPFASSSRGHLQKISCFFFLLTNVLLIQEYFSSISWICYFVIAFSQLFLINSGGGYGFEEAFGAVFIVDWVDIFGEGKCSFQSSA